MIPMGILTDCVAVLAGGILGALLGKQIPSRIKENLPKVFGVCSIAMGIVSVTKIFYMPAVVLAVILGTGVGELLYLDRKIGCLGRALQKPAEKIFMTDKTGISQEEFSSEFVTLIVLFCASGTGIFGSLQSGMTGDHSILISKAVLDFFTAMVFATRLGLPVSAVSLPQFCVMILLFLSANLLMPLVTPSMLSDFSACGGILMIATGFKMSGLLDIAIANMIPAMILVFPLSWLWGMM